MFNDRFSVFYFRSLAWFRDTPTRMAGLGRPFALSLFFTRSPGGTWLDDLVG